MRVHGRPSHSGKQQYKRLRPAATREQEKPLLASQIVPVLQARVEHQRTARSKDECQLVEPRSIMAEGFGLNKVVQEINYVTKQTPQVKSKEDIKRKLKLIVQSGFQ